jgi:hypothetical protein
MPTLRVAEIENDVKAWSENLYLLPVKGVVTKVLLSLR